MLIAKHELQTYWKKKKSIFTLSYISLKFTIKKNLLTVNMTHYNVPTGFPRQSWDYHVKEKNMLEMYFSLVFLAW